MLHAQPSPRWLRSSFGSLFTRRNACGAPRVYSVHARNVSPVEASIPADASQVSALPVRTPVTVAACASDASTSDMARAVSTGLRRTSNIHQPDIRGLDHVTCAPERVGPHVAPRAI